MLQLVLTMDNGLFDERHQQTTIDDLKREVDSWKATCKHVQNCKDKCVTERDKVIAELREELRLKNIEFVGFRNSNEMIRREYEQLRSENMQMISEASNQVDYVMKF